MRYLLLLWVGWAACTFANPLDLPPELEPWQGWVLYGHPDAACPPLQGSNKRHCTWLNKLQLNAHAKGGEFQFTLDVYGRSFVPLPGNHHYWPAQVKAGEQALSVVDRNHTPGVWLEPGHYLITGTLPWQGLPLQLPIPADLGLLELTLNGTKVANPNRDSKGRLWLREAEPQAPSQAEVDRLTVQVFRKLEDTIPQLLETQLQLQVSGAEREVTLSPVLLPGFIARTVDSPLPARLEEDGRLRLQIKPGRYTLNISAHAASPLAAFTIANPSEHWPEQEIWAFAAHRELRTVQLEGAPIIDASQTQMPGQWQHLPSYLLEPKSTLTLELQHRGDPTPASNDLSLSKTLWLDFDGAGFTVEDNISGTLNQGWRLEVNHPYQLGRAELDGEPQLITTLATHEQAGLELRTRELDLTAVSESPRTQPLPVSGWQQEFTEVDLDLNLPPGWSALHISGADRVSGTWLSGWNLWDMFLVLVIAVAFWRVLGWQLGLLVLVSLLFVYQRAGAPVISWLALVAGFALLPFGKARIQQGLTVYLGVCFALLALILLPFMVREARQAIYPQLAVVATGFSSFTTTSNKRAESDRYSSDLAVEEVMVQGIRASGPMDEKEMRYRADYDPSQKIQVGPGIPEWSWQNVTAHWSGPILASDTTRIVLAGPMLTRIGHLFAIILPGSLLLLLGLRFWASAPLKAWPSLSKPLASLGTLLLLAVLQPPPAQAAIEIDSELLKTLEQRLLAPAECLPDCAALESLRLAINDDTLSLRLTLSSDTDFGVPLPATLNQWWPHTVLVDGKPGAVLTTQGKQLYLLLRPGQHQVSLQGDVTALQGFNLNFGLMLHNVLIDAPGWSVSGEPTAQQTSQTLVFKREAPRTLAPADQRLTPAAIAPYVQVTRALNLGLEWTVDTTVTRIAPATGAIHLNIPLLPGEAPVTGERNADGTMSVRLGAEQQSFHWQSNLPVTAELSLRSGEHTPWSEVWRVYAGPIWHTSFSGIPEVASSDDNVWPLWQPLPGEQLNIAVSRPKPTPSQDFAIDTLSLTATPGKRVTDTELSLNVRATYGSQLLLPLPAGASLKGVSIDERVTPVSHSEQQVKIPIVPGEQEITVQWQTGQGAALITATPALALGSSASNIDLTLELPYNRWVLMVGGPLLGPAILFWGLLIVVLVLAVGLAKTRLTPLKVYEWVLLSLGVATINIWVLALTALWFVALTLRGRVTHTPTKPSFNLLQILLMGLSVITLLALVASVPSSLLSAPQMYITGNHSSAHSLHWYYDQSSDQLPTAWVLSLPMLLYRLMMLAWSLWLAFALIRWLKWGWQQLNTSGFWVTKPHIDAPPTGTQAGDQPGPKS